MSVTVPVPIARHLTSYLVAAVAAVALALAVVAALVVANDDASPSPRSHSSVTEELPSRFSEGHDPITTGVPQELPSRFSEGHSPSADATGR